MRFLQQGPVAGTAGRGWTVAEHMFRMLVMCSMPDDRTARAVIRDEALRLFAARGPDAVTVRQIAAAAGVSPGLVLHHFGSKAGLREAVDQHVLGLFDLMLGELTGEAVPDLYDPGASGSLAEAIAGHLVCLVVLGADHHAGSRAGQRGRMAATVPPE